MVRHGQTEFNKLGIIQGSGINASLDETGRLQSQNFFETYKSIAFDRVYTSMLVRTEESVSEFLELGLPHTRLAGLNEIDWGTKEGKKISPDSDKEYFNILQEWKNNNLDAAFEDGESPLEVQERQSSALNYIMDQDTEKQILICMHGRAMRVFLSTIFKTPLKNMDNYEHSNLCLYKIGFASSEGFKLILANDTNHLH